MKISDHMLEKVEGHKERIGQLLLKHTTLTEDQLDEALEIQRESGLMLGEILLKKNYIHPHDIIKVICHQVEIPYVAEVKIDETGEIFLKSNSVMNGYFDDLESTAKVLNDGWFKTGDFPVK